MSTVKRNYKSRVFRIVQVNNKGHIYMIMGRAKSLSRRNKAKFTE